MFFDQNLENFGINVTQKYGEKHLNEAIQKFKRFLNYQFCPYQDINEKTNLSIHYPYCFLASKEDPYEHYTSGIDFYEDLPFKLGHHSLEEMKKAFVKTIYPEYYFDSHGKRCKNTKSIVFYWKIDTQ